MTRALLLLVVVLAGCDAANDQAEAPERTAGQAAPQSNLSGYDNVALPADRTPIEEPRAPIDPKSAEAAGQAVQSFGALVEQKRWAEAESLWGDAGAAERFTDELRRMRETHLEIGKPGEPEGAAGSIYVSVPIILYGKDQAGAEFRKGADIILRRVNDVPGSTEAQRRWHIERIETAQRS